MEEKFHQRIKKTLLDNIIDLIGIKNKDLLYKHFFSNSSMKMWAAAFTHLTYSEDNYDSYEWVGDVVIDTEIAILIVKNNPNYKESQLSELKSELVNNTILANVAKKYGFDKLLRTRSLPQTYINYILSDVVEAFFFVLYYIGNQIGKGVGEKMVRNVLIGMLGEELEEKNAGNKIPAKTYVSQFVKNLTGYDIKLEKITINKQGYSLYLPEEVLNKLEEAEVYIKNSPNLYDEYYGFTTENNHLKAEKILYKELYDELIEMGITKDYIDRNKNKTIFKKFVDSQEDKEEAEEIVEIIKKKMKKDKFSYLKIEQLEKKGSNKKISFPKRLYGLFGVRKINNQGDTLNIPILSYETDSNVKTIDISASLLKNYAKNNKYVE